LIILILIILLINIHNQLLKYIKLSMDKEPLIFSSIANYFIKNQIKPSLVPHLPPINKIPVFFKNYYLIKFHSIHLSILNKITISLKDNNTTISSFSKHQISISLLKYNEYFILLICDYLKYIKNIIFKKKEQQ
jgi:hypothetical protein